MSLFVNVGNRVGLLGIGLLAGFYAGVEASEYADDDAVTARTDADGATIRPIRFHVEHSADSARNASLVGIDMMPHDRHAARSFRQGRQPDEGQILRISAWGARAGEAVGVRRIVVRYTVSSRSGRIVTDTTVRSDADGATLHVPTVGLMNAPDSPRNADLGSRSTDRDRHFVVVGTDPAKAEGMAHRLLLGGDGRAGTALGVRRAVVRYSVVPRAGRLSTDTTARTDADAAHLHVPTVGVRHAPDSAMNASLSDPSQDRDRFDTRHGFPHGLGAVHRLAASGDGRAGSCLAVRRIVVTYSVVPEDRRGLAT